MRSSTAIAFSRPGDGGAKVATRDFRQTDEDCYSLVLVELGIEFQANYVRRERHETVGELVVVADLSGARTVDGNVLSRGTFNFSSTETRFRRARQLAAMSRTPELDWARLLEEVCAKVLAAQSAGEAAVLLRDVPRPAPDAVLDVEGLRLLKQHPVILFGDGGAAKSYLALFVAGRLAQAGLRVGLFDWELAGEDHRERLERLFGPEMPPVWYRRCRHPLIVELDSLRRLVRHERLEYLIYDSVAFAAHDKPEDAASALRYFSATRQIGPGSLHVAHVTKSESGEDKPFGSAYWHNSARATYFMKRAGESTDHGAMTIGVFNRKANLGALLPAFALQFTFEGERTIVRRTNIAGVQDFAAKLPLWQRMKTLLQNGAVTVATIAEELQVPEASVRQTLKRDADKAGKRTTISMFTRVDGGLIGLLERRVS